MYWRRRPSKSFVLRLEYVWRGTGWPATAGNHKIARTSTTNGFRNLGMAESRVYPRVTIAPLKHARPTPLAPKPPHNRNRPSSPRPGHHAHLHPPRLAIGPCQGGARGRGGASGRSLSGMLVEGGAPPSSSKWKGRLGVEQAWIFFSRRRA